MIKGKRAVTLAEVKELIKDEKDEHKEIIDYLKKFGKLSKEKSEALVNDLKKAANVKLKEEHYVKLADFIPKDVENLNKVLGDISLPEDEANAILGITSKY